MVSEIGLHFSLRFFKEVCKLVLCGEHFLFSDMGVNLLHGGEVIPPAQEHHFIYGDGEGVTERRESVATPMHPYLRDFCDTTQAVDVVVYVGNVTGAYCAVAVLFGNGREGG